MQLKRPIAVYPLGIAVDKPSGERVALMNISNNKNCDFHNIFSKFAKPARFLLISSRLHQADSNRQSPSGEFQQCVCALHTVWQKETVLFNLSF